MNKSFRNIVENCFKIEKGTSFLINTSDEYFSLAEDLAYQKVN